MKQLTLIGIGTGAPSHVTLAGQQAMCDADVILIPRKAGNKDDLVEVRREILRQSGSQVPIVEFDLPVRDAEGDYRQGVDDWHDAIALAWQTACPNAVQHVALLVWGDPSLYDSTLRIANRLASKPEVRVVPGITALQALTAAHAIPLNEINAPVLITTGRQLREKGWPNGVLRAAVLLDGECSFTSLEPDRFRIWWGAHLGMDNQVLRSGLLAEVSDDIVETRAKARARHGWVMDTYLLERIADQETVVS